MKLPEPPNAALQHSRLVTKDGVFGVLYTPEQVLAYGRKCAEAMRERCALVAEDDTMAQEVADAIRKLEIE